MSSIFCILILVFFTSSALRRISGKIYIKFIMNPEAATENGDSASLNEILNCDVSDRVEIFRGAAEGKSFHIFQYLIFNSQSFSYIIQLLAKCFALF